MKCPACKEPALVMTERQGIEIDYCPSCRGLWLDRGELDKILERSRAEAEPPRRDRDGDRNYEREAADRRHYENSYKYKRKKSFLEELFD